MTMKKFGTINLETTDPRLVEGDSNVPTPTDLPTPLNVPKPGPRNPLPVEKRPI